jgi:hypothetical protein
MLGNDVSNIDLFSRFSIDEITITNATSTPEQQHLRSISSHPSRYCGCLLIVGLSLLVISSTDVQGSCYTLCILAVLGQMALDAGEQKSPLIGIEGYVVCSM